MREEGKVNRRWLLPAIRQSSFRCLFKTWNFINSKNCVSENIEIAYETLKGAWHMWKIDYGELLGRLELTRWIFSHVICPWNNRRRFKVSTHLLLVSWKPPSSRRILANRTALKNGTSIISSRLRSTQNLYFFFFIINAMPGAALGPSNVINKFKMMPLWWVDLLDEADFTRGFQTVPFFIDVASSAQQPRSTRENKITNWKTFALLFFFIAF